MTTRPDVQRVLATTRARPDEIYYASYVRDGDLSVSSGEERIATASDHELPSGIDSTWWVVGDGVQLFRLATRHARGPQVVAHGSAFRVLC